MDLPRFAVMRLNEFGNFDVMSTTSTFEQAVEKMKNFHSQGYACYLVALAFIADKHTDIGAQDAKNI